MSLYELRHKDRVVATLDIADDDPSLGTIKEIIDPSFLLISAQKDKDKFSLWWKRRAIPASRSDVKSLLTKYRIKSTHQILLDNLGLSAIDAYWVCPKDKDISWSEISFHSNAQFLSLEAKYYNENKSSDSYTPDASLGGQLDKKWIKRNGSIYLVKGNIPGHSFQQSLNEVFASTIHDKQNFKNHVEYKLVKLKNGTCGCRSKCFTSENIEFVPAWEIFSKYGYKKNETYLEQYLHYAEKEGVPIEEHRKFLNYQFLTDFIITNTDRHLSNFGILRDSNTLKGISPAPIFDSGNSMFFDGVQVIAYRTLLNVKIRSLYSTERKTIENIKDYSVVDLSQLPKGEDVVALYSKDPTQTFFLPSIRDCYEAKIGILNELQNGKTLSQIRSEIISCYSSKERSEKSDLALFWKNRE